VSGPRPGLLESRLRSGRVSEQLVLLAGKLQNPWAVGSQRLQLPRLFPSDLEIGLPECVRCIKVGWLGAPHFLKLPGSLGIPVLRYQSVPQP